MRSLPPLSSVRVFEAAARHENFTQAAAELGMTQAAVSYQIRLLEERLGVALFQRSKQRVSLTDAGRRVAPTVTAALDSIADGFGGLVDEDETLLAISTTQSVASNWLAPRLGLFQVERPDLAVRLRTDNRLTDFAADDADVGLRMGEGPWPGLRRSFLFRLHSAPFCSPDFAERHGLRAPPDLLRVPRLSPGDIWWRWWFAAAGVEEGEAPHHGGIRMDSQVLEGQAAMAGHGVAMLTPLFWRAEVAAGRLVQPFPLHVLEPASLWLVYPEHKRGRAKIRAFRAWLEAQVAAEAARAPAEIFIPPEA